MRRREFLRKLESELSHLEKAERDEIIDYYNELILDTMDRTNRDEEDIIYDLGSIEDIVRRVDPYKGSSYENNRPANKIRYDEEDDNQAREPKAKKHHHHHEYATESERERHFESNYGHKQSSSKGARVAIGVLIVIFTFPAWFGLIMGMIGTIIGIVCANIAAVVAGVGLTGAGIGLLTTSLTYGLFQIGIGVAIIGASLIIFPLITKLISWLIKLVVRFIKWLCGSVSRSVRGNSYEN